MTKLNIDQKNILSLFTEKNPKFLIPDYQRPYSWWVEECQTLWDDLFAFSFPNDNANEFNDNSEYFLWPIVTFENEYWELEVIDWQQRLTTLLLLLRAFYPTLENMKDEKSQQVYKDIASCIREVDGFWISKKEALKINSVVASDSDKDEFLTILMTWNATDKKNKYAENFKFFQKQIEDFLANFASYLAYFPNRILRNCILLPIQAESQDTALRIFSTLNDRWKPLSDTDIFKAQLYKYFKEQWIDKKDKFIEERKALEEMCDSIFSTKSWSPMDELFTRYMYYKRASLWNKKTTLEWLRKFYEKNKYDLLKKDSTFEELKELANFWYQINVQNECIFSMPVLRQLFILNYSPNVMRTYLVSTYFMANKDKDWKLDQEKFSEYLDKIIWYIFTYAVIQPWVSSIKVAIFKELVHLAKPEEEPESCLKLDYPIDNIKNIFNEYQFSNWRPITRSILIRWMFTNKEQTLFSLDTTLEVEHIFARKRQEIEKSLMNSDNIESLWNKSMLEKKVNIRAADYRFSDKKNYYRGFPNDKWKNIKWTEIKELLILSQKSDFIESDIIERKNKIITSFIEYLGICWLLNSNKNSVINNPLNYDWVGHAEKVEMLQNTFWEKRYHFRRMKRVHATLIVSDWKFIVKKWSRICPYITSNESTIYKLRQKLAEYIDDNYITTRDIRFKTPSWAWQFVYWAASNWWDDRVDENGVSLWKNMWH